MKWLKDEVNNHILALSIPSKDAWRPVKGKTHASKDVSFYGEKTICYCYCRSSINMSLSIRIQCVQYCIKLKTI